MPGTRCTVAVCNNSFAKTKKAGMPIMYHQFPKAKSMRNIWIQRCRRAGQWNPNSCHVCSIHFTEDDYQEDISSFGRKRLKSSAIPTLFLMEPPFLEIASTQHRKRKKQSLEDEISTDCIYLKVDNLKCKNETDDNLQFYEICKSENSSNENDEHKPISKIEDVEITASDDVASCYYKTTENYDSVKFSELHYITVIDNSTQVEEDYFLKNYKQLMNKNNKLEIELFTWKSRCKRLMSQFTQLQPTLDNKII